MKPGIISQVDLIFRSVLRRTRRRPLVLMVCAALSAGIAMLPAQTAFAMDPDGCLTCHQYPGLVTSEKPPAIKILHIDENSYLKSVHGSLTCKQCHAVIKKVPHTGETEVQCNSECHKSKAEQIKVRNFPLRDFHIKEQSAIARLDDDSSCRVCHPLYPHSTNNMVRALLNLHAGFMVCSVCHLKKEKYPGCYYAWNSSENADFIGDPFGTFYNPKLKRAHKSKHFLSRISVFTTVNGKRKPLMNTWDTAAAKEFMRDKAKLPDDVVKQRLVFFHRDINRKEISVACNECHSTNSILDFKALGFDEKTRNNLINLNIKGLVTHYKTFYFPQLFNK